MRSKQEKARKMSEKQRASEFKNTFAGDRYMAEHIKRIPRLLSSIIYHHYIGAN